MDRFKEVQGSQDKDNQDPGLVEGRFGKEAGGEHETRASCTQDSDCCEGLVGQERVCSYAYCRYPDPVW
jgi:hypothetical protein